jgi:hypothetical protein
VFGIKRENYEVKCKNVSIILEISSHRYTHREERVLGFLEHAVFGDGVRDLVFLDDEVLLEDLHGVQLAGALLARQHHLPERAFAQHLHELELLQGLRKQHTLRAYDTFIIL